MKLIRIFVAAIMALALFSSCTKDDAVGTLTINGKTYNDITATYFIENDHFFNLFVTGAEIEGFGMCDTPAAFGKTVTIDEEFGYGDRLFMDVNYKDGKSYSAMPAKGKQTIKKKDSTHVLVEIDTVDEEGKAYKLSVVAKEENKAK